jgi:hypothetical protein
MWTRFSSSDPGAGPERRGTRTRKRRRSLEGGRVRRTGAGPAVQMSKGTSTKQLNFLILIFFLGGGDFSVCSYEHFLIFIGSQNPGTNRRTHSFAVIDISSA